MKTKLATAFILLAFILTGIQLRADEQTRKVEPFTEISLPIGAKVYLKQGEKQNLKIEAKSSTLDDLITEVKNGKLIIRFTNKDFGWSSFKSGEITIYVTIPEINGLSVSGSGDIIAEDEIKTKNMDMAVSGSGNIRLSDLSAEHVKSAISGSGNIFLAGKTAAQELSVAVSGSGNFKGLDYSADDVLIKVSGSGKVGIGANKKLDVHVSGSGNVTYKGNPQINQSVSGSGSVRNAK